MLLRGRPAPARPSTSSTSATRSTARWTSRWTGSRAHLGLAPRRRYSGGKPRLGGRQPVHLPRREPHPRPGLAADASGSARPCCARWTTCWPTPGCWSREHEGGRLRALAPRLRDRGLPGRGRPRGRGHRPGPGGRRGPAAGTPARSTSRGSRSCSQAGQAAGRLCFAVRRPEALAEAEVLWVTFDTPVDEKDEADVDYVRRQLEGARGRGPAPRHPGARLVPGPRRLHPRALEDWAGRGLRFACSPENLRLGQAIESFRKPDRVVVGVRGRSRAARRGAPAGPSRRPDRVDERRVRRDDQARAERVPGRRRRLRERGRASSARGLGRDATRGRARPQGDRRIGPGPTSRPGRPSPAAPWPATSATWSASGARHGTGTPLLEGVLRSNAAHAAAQRAEVRGLLSGPDPVAAVLGLAYKPGTSTLRRSSSLELCRALHADGVTVRAHDPAVRELPAELAAASGSARAPARRSWAPTWR